jgi:hypothetical protein
VLGVSNSPSFADDGLMAFFTTATANIIATVKKVGVGHHVTVPDKPPLAPPAGR